MPGIGQRVWDLLRVGPLVRIRPPQCWALDVARIEAVLLLLAVDYVSRVTRRSEPNLHPGQLGWDVPGRFRQRRSPASPRSRRISGRGPARAQVGSSSTGATSSGHGPVRLRPSFRGRVARPFRSRLSRTRDRKATRPRVPVAQKCIALARVEALAGVGTTLTWDHQSSDPEAGARLLPFF